ncbi:MAG: ribonuclease III [Thermoleophilia bacterium]
MTRHLLALVEELPQPLFEQALTHSSWVTDRVRSYERLEFLGDSVLGLSIAAHLYEHFAEVREGDLARWKAFVVSRGSCHVVACRLGLDHLVRTRAPADEAQRDELAATPTALGNILEALIGACYLTYEFSVVGEAVVHAFQDQVTFAVREYVDFKSTLQETLAAEGRVAEYELMEEEGPPHDRVFRSRVSSGDEALGQGSGRSIKKSEQRAAREALGRLGVLPEYDAAAEIYDPRADDQTCAAAGDGE